MYNRIEQCALPYIYMCVYIYVYIYVYICIYIYIYIYIYTYNSKYNITIWWRITSVGFLLQFYFLKLYSLSEAQNNNPV